MFVSEALVKATGGPGVLGRGDGKADARHPTLSNDLFEHPHHRTRGALSTTLRFHEDVAYLRTAAAMRRDRPLLVYWEQDMTAADGNLSVPGNHLNEGATSLRLEPPPVLGGTPCWKRTRQRVHVALAEAPDLERAQPIGTSGRRASAASSCAGSNSTSGSRAFR